MKNLSVFDSRSPFRDVGTSFALNKVLKDVQYDMVRAVSYAVDILRMIIENYSERIKRNDEGNVRLANRPSKDS